MFVTYSGWWLNPKMIDVKGQVLVRQYHSLSPRFLNEHEKQKIQIKKII
jgi:hypothetical protein